MPPPPATTLAAAVEPGKVIVALPYGLWQAGVRTAALRLRALGGADELALAEALAAGASAARAGNLLIGRCAAFADAAAPLGMLAAADLALGDREVVLRALHVVSLGPGVEGRTACAHCGAAVEYDLNLDQPTERPPEPGPWHQLAIPGGTIKCRVLTGADLERAAGSVDTDSLALLADAATGGQAVSGAAGREILGAALARLDPNAETAVSVGCPVCGRITRFWLDSFELIRRGLAAAGGVMRQIHTLAAAYGWSESEILTLPRHRRLLYCRMVAAGSPG